MIDTTTILIIIGLLILAKVNSLAKQNAKDNDTNTSAEDLQSMGKEILDAIGSLGGVVTTTKKKK